MILRERREREREREERERERREGVEREREHVGCYNSQCSLCLCLYVSQRVGVSQVMSHCRVTVDRVCACVCGCVRFESRCHECRVGAYVLRRVCRDILMCCDESVATFSCAATSLSRHSPHTPLVTCTSESCHDRDVCTT